MFKFQVKMKASFHYTKENGESSHRSGTIVDLGDGWIKLEILDDNHQASYRTFKTDRISDLIADVFMLDNQLITCAEYCKQGQGEVSWNRDSTLNGPATIVYHQKFEKKCS